MTHQNRDKLLTCYHGNPWLDHFDPPIGTGQGCSLCQTDIRGERHDMAKQSKLDREIEKAQGEYDEAEMSYCIAGRVLMALKEAKSEDGKANNVPKVKRGRKAKGLPKPNGAEVTQ
jgi:hypothetical protein